MRTLRALSVLFIAFAVGSCDPSEYCLNCDNIDGPPGPGEADARVDGGPRADACVPTQELCDGLDNDCNGLVDDGAVTQVGETCGNSTPPCSEGVWECNAGTLECTGVVPTAELCDGIDNDCNGAVDNGNPGAGASCGTDAGECVAGLTECQSGAIVCVGAMGEPGANPEVCDGRDNDCDNEFDEDITAGPCGVTDVGECELGVESCVGGQMVCAGAVGPTFELCDASDQDCDGNPTNGYDLQGDPVNCGGCGNVCSLPNAVEGCSMGSCTVAFCEAGWFDNDPLVPGCEYACDFESTIDVCNLRDDDCDGQIDEDAVPPAGFCGSIGPCAGATTTCTANGWRCNYGPDVSTDESGAIIPETTCDGIDNDCDGATDEAFPVGTACVDDNLGVCQGRGTYQCAADPMAPAECNITTPGQTPSTESCNGEDDDCDGTVDDGALTGALQEWVTTSGGVQIMKYEASRPDATAANAGTLDGYACSKPGVQPWVNVRQPVAEATCAAIGARLCSEAEWQTACAVRPPVTYPVDEPTTGNGQVVLEAEQYESAVSGVSGGTTFTWQASTAIADYRGTSAMQALPNIGTAVSLANAVARSPRMSYAVNVTVPGTHYVWVRMAGNSNSDDDIHVGVATTRTAAPTISIDGSSQWRWLRVGTTFTLAAGVNYINVYMQTDGVLVDQIALTRDSSPPQDLVWSYATAPTTYQPGVCNEDVLDTDTGTAGDQDDILPTGSLAQCRADWPSDDVYDLSGNVREWTAERGPGANPIRGGASNNTGPGISCELDFTLADDQFFFPNVGFRCCR